MLAPQKFSLFNEEVKITSFYDSRFGTSFRPHIKYGVNSSRNPGVVPAKAGTISRTGFPFSRE